MGIRAHLAIFGFSDNKLIVFDHQLHTVETRVTERKNTRPNLYRISCNGDRLLNHRFRFLFCLFTICFFSRRPKCIAQVSDCMNYCEHKEHAIELRENECHRNFACVRSRNSDREKYSATTLRFPIAVGRAWIGICFNSYLLFCAIRAVQHRKMSSVKREMEERSRRQGQRSSDGQIAACNQSILNIREREESKNTIADLLRIVGGFSLTNYTNISYFLVRIIIESWALQNKSISVRVRHELLKISSLHQFHKKTRTSKSSSKSLFDASVVHFRIQSQIPTHPLWPRNVERATRTRTDKHRHHPYGRRSRLWDIWLLLLSLESLVIVFSVFFFVVYGRSVCWG